MPELPQPIDDENTKKFEGSPKAIEVGSQYKTVKEIKTGSYWTNGDAHVGGRSTWRSNPPIPVGSEIVVKFVDPSTGKITIGNLTSSRNFQSDIQMTPKDFMEATGHDRRDGEKPFGIERILALLDPNGSPEVRPGEKIEDVRKTAFEQLKKALSKKEI